MIENIKQQGKHKLPADVVLSTNNLTKAFGGQIVIDDISFNVRKGRRCFTQREGRKRCTVSINIITNQDLIINPI
jgi:ABC-type branched-subunit amino acid transport system ATPase component